MTTLSTLKELERALREAKGPSYALECSIAIAFGEPEQKPLPYTSNLDAAMALCERVFDSMAIDIEVAKRIVCGKTHGRAEICGLNCGEGGKITAATPALALCLAIVRAKIAEM